MPSMRETMTHGTEELIGYGPWAMSDLLFRSSLAHSSSVYQPYAQTLYLSLILF